MSKTSVTEPYKQFENDMHDLVTSDHLPSSVDSTHATSLSIDSNTIFESDRISTLDHKERSKRKILIWIQLLTAILLVIFESVSTSMSCRAYWGFGAKVCHAGSGVWVGVAGIATGALGFVWMRKVDRNESSKKTFTKAYFCMSILDAVFDGILVVLAAVCMTQSIAYVVYAKKYVTQWPYLVVKDDHMTVIAFNVIMVIAAMIQMIANILATVMMCRSWWMNAGQKVSPLTLIYVGDNLSTNRMPTLSIEKGSRVMFMPQKFGAKNETNGSSPQKNGTKQ